MHQFGGGDNSSENSSVCPTACDANYFSALAKTRTPLLGPSVDSNAAVKDHWMYPILFGNSSNSESDNFAAHASLDPTESARTDLGSLYRARFGRFGAVKINFDVPHATRITKEKRVSFADAVSSVGGTLGLFTGFSILSIIEIVHWALKAVLDR